MSASKGRTQSQSQTRTQTQIHNNNNDNYNRYSAKLLSNGFLKVEMTAAPTVEDSATIINSEDDVVLGNDSKSTTSKNDCDSGRNGNGNDNHNDNDNDNNNDDPPKTESTIIPETVLQYERQLRKNRAAKRASTPLDRSTFFQFNSNSNSNSNANANDNFSNVLHNDDHIIVVNKPSGVLTVPGINSNPSLLSFLYKEYKDEIDTEMKMEHMIIHRLDMDTSGIVIFAKDKQSMSKLQKSFRERQVEKEYEALVCGHLPLNILSGCINLPLQRDHQYPPFMRVATAESERQAQVVVKDLNHAGWKKIIKKKPKQSETLFEVLGREFVSVPSIKGKEKEKEKEKDDKEQKSTSANDDKDDSSNNIHNDNHLPVTRLRLKPITGRTHQLRVHCAAIGHPILGDPAYGIMGEAGPNGGFDHDTMSKLMPHKASVQLQLDLDKYVKAVDQCLCLHARKLVLKHPISELEMSFDFPAGF